MCDLYLLISVFVTDQIVTLETRTIPVIPF